MAPGPGATGERMMKTSLGRGLGSLLGEVAVQEVEGQKVRFLALDQLVANQHQPRQVFPEATLSELADSIREQGVLQPVLVRKVSGRGESERYELVAGERRWRAARMAGLREIPALVRELNDLQSAEIALLENVQREDLGPLEVARGYLRLVDEFGYTHEAVAKRLGLSRMAVSNTLRLLRLPPEVLELLEIPAGEFTAGHGRALLGLEEEPGLLVEVAGEVLARGLSVRETERLVRERKQEAAKRTAPGDTGDVPKVARKDAAILAMEERLAQHLGSRVTITSRGGRGRVILEYGTMDGLERLVGQLLG